uniref:Anaphase-promoting complex subunit 4 WD40 domain-containing protein n=2 Tax=Aureoumbra lagunensis TaxID=44058 RepID=A0A7S3NN28_9STRA|mmetsp:Transcript_18704/g.28200  ORF Transcript_18704/g.28200 Transcript_18704/m.28200 type:complete len:847 (+) Transcript_18704:89-2629(+)
MMSKSLSVNKIKPLIKEDRPIFSVREEHANDGWYGCHSCGFEMQLELLPPNQELRHGISMFNCKVCASTSQCKSKKRFNHDDSANRVYCMYCCVWIRSDKWKKHDMSHSSQGGSTDFLIQSVGTNKGGKKIQKRSSLRVLAIRDPRTLNIILTSPVCSALTNIKSNIPKGFASEKKNGEFRNKNFIRIGLLEDAENIIKKDQNTLLIDTSRYRDSNFGLIINAPYWRGPIARLILTIQYKENNHKIQTEQILVPKTVRTSEKSGITITTILSDKEKKQAKANLKLEIYASNNLDAQPTHSRIISNALIFTNLEPLRNLLMSLQTLEKESSSKNDFIHLARQSLKSYKSPALWWSCNAKVLDQIQILAQESEYNQICDIICMARWAYIKSLNIIQLQKLCNCGLEEYILQFIGQFPEATIFYLDDQDRENKKKVYQDPLKLLVAATEKDAGTSSQQALTSKECVVPPLKKQSPTILLSEHDNLQCQANSQEDCFCIFSNVSTCALNSEAMIVASTQVPLARIFSLYSNFQPIDLFQSAPVTCTTICTLSKYTAIGNADGLVQVYNAASLLWSFAVNPSTPISLAFDPNGRMLTAICFDGTLRLWDLTNGTQCAHIAAGALPFSQITMSTHLICVADVSLRIWDLNSGHLLGGIPLKSPVQQVQDLSICNLSICAIAFSDDSTFLAAAISQDDIARIYNPFSGILIQAHALSTTRSANRISALAFDHHSQRLAIGAYDSTIRIYHLATEILHFIFQHNTASIIALSFSKDDRHIAAATAHNASLAFFDTTTGARLALPGTNLIPSCSKPMPPPIPIVMQTAPFRPHHLPKPETARNISGRISPPLSII